MTLIALHHVSRHYATAAGTVRALDDLSLCIDSGEMVAIMGASGSGKSTLMNLLGCLDRPSSGKLYVDGRDLGTMSSEETAALRRESFGFIFQRYHLLPQLDAVANVELPAVYAGMPAQQRRDRAAALLCQLGLGERLYHRPHALSGGQQQRVSIARALMNGGRIILADEPTGALDSATGAEILNLLTELNAQGHTIILVTHDPDVAAYAGRIIELHDGRVVRDERREVCVRSVKTTTPLAAPSRARSMPSRRFAGRLAAWREAFAVSVSVLISNRLRAALSTLGIAIGISAVVGVVALGDGLQVKLRLFFEAMGTPTLQVASGNWLQRPGLPSRPLTGRDVAAVEAIPGVAAARLLRSSLVTARYGNRDTQWLVKGAGVGDLARANEAVAHGRDINALDLEMAATVALLNKKAAEGFFSTAEQALGQRVLVGERTFTVVGITQTRSVQPVDATVAAVYVPDSTFDHQIENGAEAKAMTVFTLPTYSTSVLLEPLRTRLRDLHGGVEDFMITDSYALERAGQAMLTAAQAVMGAIAAVSLLVGGVGVMNIMLVSVAERTREIGIRMAIGARQNDIRRQFLIESVLVCGLGALAGLVLPWLVAQLLPLANVDLLLTVGWRAAALAIGTSTAIGLVFGNVPATRAARLDPVVALARE